MTTPASFAAAASPTAAGPASQPPGPVLFSERVPGGANWSHPLKRGTTLRLIDVEGGANVGALFFNFELLAERFNLGDTLKAQHTAHLTTGFVLFSDMGRVLCSITADTCGWHDPLGGCSTEEGVTRQFGPKTFQEARNAFHRNARDNFLMELGKYGLGPRDLTANINFFSKVGVDELGAMRFVPQTPTPAPGRFVDLRAELNTLIILNTCPHPLDPAPAYQPKPVDLVVWASSPPASDDPCRTARPETERGFILTERFFL